MATTEVDQKAPIATASAFDEESKEYIGRVKHILQEARKSTEDDVLMSLKGFDEFDGADTEFDRWVILNSMHAETQQLATRGAVQRTLGGMKALTRQYDAFFEMPEFADLADLNAAQDRIAMKARAAQSDYGWENFGEKVRFYSQEEEWSPDALRKALQQAEGTFSPDRNWEGGKSGFSFESETTELVGVKALLSSLVGSTAGIEPYAEQMALIVEQAIRRPTLFRLLSSASVRSNSYIYRQESGVTGTFGYANEPTTSAGVRAVPTASLSLKIGPTTKNLKTMLGEAVMNYEQLYSEPIARNWIRMRLVEQGEIWIDGELFSGAGGQTAIQGLSNFTPDSTTPATAGNWASGAGGSNNFYQKDAAGTESDMQALFEMLVHAETEDHGHTVPTVLCTSPAGYQHLVNPRITNDDARWLFPQVMAGGDARPMGLTVVKNTQVPANENYILDPRHLVFRPHAQGLVFEYDKEPRQLVEYMVVHLLFEFDIYRTYAVMRGDGFAG